MSVAGLRRRSRASGTAPLPITGQLDQWRQVLDGLRTNIFLADPDLTLVFANAQARATLTRIEPQLQRSFGLRAADIVGGSIHRFHQDPQRVERVLHQEGFTLPHVAVFSFGDVELSTNIDAVKDHTGATIGYAVAWEDVSDMRKARAHITELSEHLSVAASAVEELSASIGEIARAAVTATDTTREGVDDAERTSCSVEELGSASQAITGVIATITSIAEQTNLLALNATIEAARAGTAGKGFAVVAGEVKQLARSTAEATDDVRGRIESVTGLVSEVVTSIDGIVDRLQQIEELQSTVATTVEEQRAATDQLAGNISDAATSARTVADSYQ